jgi:hypothetical protein
LRLAARHLAIATMFVVAVVVAPVAAARPAAAAVPVAEELTMAGLGVGTQTVPGGHGLSEVYFPPPSTRLAPAGSFVRVFFSHTRDFGAGSTMLIAVNGQPLTVWRLTPGTANGGVLDVPIRPGLMDDRGPNRLQVRFDLRASGGQGAEPFGRVAGQTMLHYAFAPAAGPPGLQDYPHSLLGPAGDTPPTLGVVLPAAPDADEVTAALRVVADLGRRAGAGRARARVVVADQLAWLGAGRGSALLVGRLDRVPGAARVLQAAGWRPGGGGWTSPDGRDLRPEDGLLLSAISPWDGRTPLLLVGGLTAAGVAKAAAALTAGDEVPLAGAAAVVSDAPAQPAAPLAASSTVRLTMLDLHDLADLGPGRYRSSQGFTVPPVDPGGTAVAELAVRGVVGAGASGSLEVDLNGARVVAQGLQNVQGGTLQVPFSGRLLRTGRNVLTIDLRVDRPARSDAGGVPDAASAAAWPGDDAAATTITLPAGRPRGPDLRLLPYPLLDGDGRPLMVVVTDANAETLSAAAQALIALGGRAAGPLPPIRAAVAPRQDAGWDEDSLLVVGTPRGAGPLDRVGGALPVPVTATARPAAGPAGAPAGLVQEATIPGTAEQQVVWIAATRPELLLPAAGALADPALSGRAVAVGADGAMSPLRGRTAGAAGAGGGPSLEAALVALSALVLVGLVGVELAAPRRPRPAAGGEAGA